MAADVATEPRSAPSKVQTGDVKLSRYRSVRKAQLKAYEEVPPVPPPPPIPETEPAMETVKRSMSRYRRAKPPAQPAHKSTPERLPTAKQKSPEHRSPRQEQYKIHTKPAHPYPEYPSDALQREPRGLINRKHDEEDDDVPLGTLMEQQARRKERPANTAEGAQVLADERARHERIRAQQRAHQAERDRALQAERRKKEEAEDAIRQLEREKLAEEERVRKEREAEKERAMQEKLAAKQKVKEEKEMRKRRPTDVTVPSSRDAEGSRHTSSRGSAQSPESTKRIGGFFKRKKEDETPRTSTTTDDRRPKTNHASPPKFEMPPPPRWDAPILKASPPIETDATVPLADAPVSGVKKIERRVRIKYGTSPEINLPADVDTTAHALIKSAAQVTMEHFNPRAAIIYEHYLPQNVRRPLRMYENARTFMNSWEDDYQNYLVIEDSDPDHDRELYQAHAPQQEQLNQFEGWMEFNVKGKKWSDRWVMLRTDGQITAAKNEKGKDVTNVCNLSDFDIYRSIEDSKRKKPAKAVQLSVKSQQKSAMFLDMSDYIHHFKMDRKTADAFFRAAQDWRSSYLVNRLGQGKDKSESTTANGNHARSNSAGSGHILGDFTGFNLDFDNWDKPAEPVQPPAPVKKSFEENRPLGTFGMILPSAQEHSKMMAARQLSVRKDRSKIPPTSMRHAIPSRPGGRDDAWAALNGQPRQSTDSQRSADGSFNRNGLLGAQYDPRRHNGKPSQDNSGGVQRSGSVRSTRSFDSATLGRRDSTRRPERELDFGKPLLDFTPTYKEPPQFSKRGKGFKPEQLAPGGLIENATGRDDPLGLPGKDDWKVRPNTSAGAGLDRSKSINRSRSTRRPPHGNVPEEPEAFNPGGLLAQSRKSGWGDGNTGHGVMSGNQARGPMLNMNEQSQFGNGSLLQQMEKSNLGNPSARDEPWRVG